VRLHLTVSPLYIELRRSRTLTAFQTKGKRWISESGTSPRPLRSRAPGDAMPSDSGIHAYGLSQPEVTAT
jgi:hypothetical protein